MQINIKTRRGTVELSFRKLRIFHRINGLEDRMQTVEEQIKKLTYLNRTAEPVERKEPGREDYPSMVEEYTPSDIATEWMYGEAAAKEQREERMRQTEEKGKRGGNAV